MKHHRHFVALLLIYLFIARVYEWALPPLEHFDAKYHFSYVAKIRNDLELPYPPIDGADENGVFQQSGSPPLYYVTAALLSLLDRAPSAPLIPNPWNAELVSRRSNDNRYLHLMNPDQHAMNPRLVDYINSVHSARLASHLFGLVGLIAVYGGAYSLWKNQHIALLSAGFVAFNPKFLQETTAITNDSAAIAFGALIIWMAILLIDRWRQSRWTVVAGIVMGLAALSKANALSMWAIPCLAVAYGWFRDTQDQALLQRLRLGLRPILSMLFVAILVGGWWYIRGWILFDDPLGFNPHRNTEWGITQGPALLDFLQEIPTKSTEMWNDLGGGTIDVPTWSYYLVGIWLLAALWSWRHLPKQIEVAFLSISLLLGIVGLWRWAQVSYIVPGRLMMPYFTALALLVGWGVGQYCRWLQSLFLGSLGATALITAFVSLHFAFAAPLLLDNAPDDLQGQPIIFDLPEGDHVRFLGYRVDDEHIQQGQSRQFTLCWQGIGQHDTINVDDAFALDIITNDLERRIGVRQSMMGMGRYTLWKNEAIFCDDFWLEITGETQPGQSYMLTLTMLEYISKNALPANGFRIGSLWHPAPQIDATQRSTSPYRMGDIAMVDATIQRDGDGIIIESMWSPLRSIDQDLNWVVFLRNTASGEYVRQMDAPLGGEAYPSWAWGSGECIADEISILADNLPDGTYELLLGIYDPITLIRLPATLDGTRQPNDLINIGDIENGTLFVPDDLSQPINGC
jgi:hypothetical protein